jgi:hypothetical protein
MMMMMMMMIIIIIITTITVTDGDGSITPMHWVTGFTIGVLGFDSRRGLEIFLFTAASRTALGPTQPPIQWAPEALTLEVKRPGRGADHSPPRSAEVKE